MGFKGSVESFSLADVFQNLSMNQQTGTLKVVAGTGDEKHVYFENGQVKYMARGLRKPLLLPEVFVARGLVLKLQLDPAVERARANNEFIGPVLVAMGHINNEQLGEVVKHQIEEEIFDLFSWEKANFEFNEGNPADGMFLDQLGTKAPSLPISHLIMEAARRVDEWERLKKQIPVFKEIYVLDLQVRKQIEKGEMEVDPVEKRVAFLLDGARDVDDLIEESFLFRFEVMTALGSFLNSSLIRPATLQELNFAEQQCMKFNQPLRRIKILERILALGGENTRVRRDLAELLAKETMIDKACIHYGVLADAELQAGREEAAVEIYRRILSISPKHIKSHEQLATLYMKRGQKREAYVHYEELFETLRDQNHAAEARVAGQKALECDPSQTELRTNLIELLLADNQKEAAATQIEILGDQAAKVGNVKLAADSYRRAMQYAHNNKQLKKKLADVMLTKEDRLARKRKALMVMAAFVLLGLMAAGLAGLEYFNRVAYRRAHDTAQQRIADVPEIEKAEKFQEAAAKYREAQEAYRPITKKFSPILKYNKAATDKIAELERLATEALANDEKLRSEEERRARQDLIAGDNHMKAFEIRQARDAFKKVVENQHSSEEDAKKAKQQLEAVQKLIEKLDEGLKRLAQRPSEAFKTLTEEVAFKRGFVQQFGVNPKLLEGVEIRLPLWIRPETDLVDVYLNGRLEGTISQAAAPELNTFRYPFGAAHKFEFKKAGYKTITINTAELQQPEFKLKLEREPSYVFDLSPVLGDQSLSGDAVLNGDQLFVGTSDGSLLEVALQDKKVVRRYDLPGGGGINKEVYGRIHVIDRGAKPAIIVYCTKAGDCVGLVAAAGGFQEAWPMVKGNPTAPMSAPAAVARVPMVSRNPLVLMPFDKKIQIVDTDSGALGKTLELKVAVTSQPAVIEQGAIIAVGCEDGNVYGLSAGGEVVREWTTNAKAAAVRGRPFIYDDLLMAGADDGNIYFFESKKSGFGTAIVLEGAIVMEPLILKKRLYLGAVQREVFWCIDMATRKPNWTKAERDMGGINQTPVTIGSQVYYTTDRGKVYAIDAEKGFPIWTYQVEGGRGFAGPPSALGKRLYVISRTGKILGFDEQSR
ncbi:MAG TPA: DUF4388 domain-containing protein [Planctomycetota bacterium]|nr:DUF4388 domain-containing protein [Planctomycetota bacterium]